MKVFIIVLIACFSILSAVPNYAQSGRGGDADKSKKANQRPEPTPEPEPINSELGEIDDTDIIKIDTEIVTIPVRVLNRQGKSMTGLQKENFQIFEDGKPQEIAYFSNESQPLTVALILDLSYSGVNKINEIQQAAIAFVAQLQDRDRVMVVSFDNVIHILTQPTSDRKELYRAIKTTQIGSGTSVYEAVDTVIQKMQNISGRKAIVLFSDGVDTSSRRKTDRDNLRDVQELDAIFYPIKYDTYADVQKVLNGQVVVPPPNTSPIPGGSTTPTSLPFPLPNIQIGGGNPGRNQPNDSQQRGVPSGTGTTIEDYRIGAEYLEGLANNSGGQLYEASSTGNLALIFSRVAAELRDSYSIGYYPPEDGKKDKFHKIKVKVDQKGVAIKARNGYIAKDKK